MIISKTPLRVSLFGGGSDFPQYYLKHGGAVLTTAIDKYIYVIVKPRFDDKIVLHYTKTEVCDSVDEIKHDYIREAMRMCGISPGIEITTMADIPSEGTGLGSSSSLAVGLIYALRKYRLIPDDVESRANDACLLELDWLKKGIGIQDQYIAAYGGFRLMTFDDQGVHVKDQIANTKKLEKRLLLFYTGITRQAHSILNEHVQNMEVNKTTLMEMVLDVYAGQKALEDGNVDKIGELLHRSWVNKRKLSASITNVEIEGMYKTALKAGASGGKICGAGGGGFLLLYVEPDKQEAVREALKDYQELTFGFEKEGSRIVYSD